MTYFRLCDICTLFFSCVCLMRSECGTVCGTCLVFCSPSSSGSSMKMHFRGLLLMHASCVLLNLHSRLLGMVVIQMSFKSTSGPTTRSCPSVRSLTLAAESLRNPPQRRGSRDSGPQRQRSRPRRDSSERKRLSFLDCCPPWKRSMQRFASCKCSQIKPRAKRSTGSPGARRWKYSWRSEHRCECPTRFPIFSRRKCLFSHVCWWVGGRVHSINDFKTRPPTFSVDLPCGAVGAENSAIASRRVVDPIQDFDGRLWGNLASGVTVSREEDLVVVFSPLMWSSSFWGGGCFRIHLQLSRCEVKLQRLNNDMLEKNEETKRLVELEKAHKMQVGFFFLFLWRGVGVSG